MTHRSRLAEVATVFLRLGLTAFGGPAAHIALIESEIVQRRKWISREELLQILAAINFIPGPNSTELAIHLGYLRAGWRGLIVAGACFVLPAALLILPLGWLYVRYGQLPDLAGPFSAIRACMIAIVVAALWRFGRTGIKDVFTGVLAVLAAAAAILTQMERYRVPQAELWILGLSALAGLLRVGWRPARVMPVLAVAPVAWMGYSGEFGRLALFFLKVGATLFGSGYVLLSYLRGGLVEDMGWLSTQQLTDAIVVGQVTPGPLLTTATFVGYILGHQWAGFGGAVSGAAIATVAIFLPSFVLVAAVQPVWQKLRTSGAAKGALDGMNAAVVALILAVTVSLASEAITTVWAGAVAVGALLAMLIWNINATWLVLAAAALGVGMSAW